MRNKKNLTHLIRQFIKSSPRSKAEQRNGVLPPEYRMNTTKLPTDQQYVKNFIVHVQCSYMYNYYGAPTVNEHKMYLHKKSFVNPLSVGLVRRKAIQINDKSLDKKTILFELIKLLNKDKNTIMRYVQMQQFLMNLSVTETREHKKIVVYLYKWLLNQKHKFPPGSIQQQLCQQTSEMIIKKIYESHEKGDNQILRNTQEELLTIQNLQKARQLKRNLFDARESYEIVYWARWTEQIDRVQALQYIMQKSRTQKDWIYLGKMVERIKQGNGIKAHQKILHRAISQIKQSVSCVQNNQEEKKKDYLQKELYFSANDSSVGVGQILLQGRDLQNQEQSKLVKRQSKIGLKKIQILQNGKKN